MNKTLFLLIIFCILSPFLSASEDLNFVAFGHVYPDYDALNESVSLVNSIDPDFSVFLGDSVHEGDISTWEELFTITNNIDTEKHFVFGNHEGELVTYMHENYIELIDDNFYRYFTFKGYDFIILNSVGNPETSVSGEYFISEEQVEFISEVYTISDRPKFIFLHHCLFLNYDNHFCNSREFFTDNNWNSEIVPILREGNTLGVFVGDLGVRESYFGYEENDVSYFGVGFSPLDSRLRNPQYFLDVSVIDGELQVISIPIRNDLTQSIYHASINPSSFEIFKSYIKKNLAFILKFFVIVICLQFLIIFLLLFYAFRLRKHRVKEIFV
jgi:calcineurin-like phosphoesterase family protein